jgi:2-succinyl-5-enolpyruvyl-6-hydroxy-3-cyclohexene-1-carboxylate synthase
VPTGGALVLSASMPVRDVEWFGPNRNDITVIANRGANGIDGVVATALGVALAGQPTVCLIGDVAFLHDSSTLIALQRRTADLTIVVTNNDGGGIFSFLPQHQLLDTASYEELFGTPHGTDLAALVRSHGLIVEDFTDPIPAPSGIRVVLASTDRQSNLTLHDQVQHAVAEALVAALP